MRSPRFTALLVAVLAQLLFLTGAALAQVGDPTARIDFRHAREGTPASSTFGKDSWGDPSAFGADPTPKVEAAKLVEEIIRSEPHVSAAAADVLRRIDYFHGEKGPRSVNPSEPWKLCENGRFIIVLDHERSIHSGGAHAYYEGDPSKLHVDPFVKVSIGQVPDRARFPAQYERFRRHVADVLLHEFDHLSIFVSEVHYVAQYKREFYERTFQAGGETVHYPWTMTNPGNALLEGAAEAAQLHAFKSASYIDPMFRADGFFNPSLWGSYRQKLPPAKRALLFLAERSKTLHGAKGSTRLSSSESPLEHLLEPDSVDPAAQIEAPDKVPVMKSLAGMIRTEGVVALILSDMYEAGLATPESLRDMIRSEGCRTIVEVIERHKAFLPAEDALRLELIHTRRTLGANLDERRAAELYEARMNGLDADIYHGQIDEIFVRKHGEAARKLVEANPVREMLGDASRAHDTDETAPKPPAEEPVTGPGAPKEKPDAAKRQKAMESHGGARKWMKAGGTLSMGVLIGYGMGLVSDFVKGKAVSLSPRDIAKTARREIFRSEFLQTAAESLASLGIQEGVEGGGEKLAQWTMRKFLSGFGVRQVMLQTTRRLPKGGLILSIISGLICNQILAHDYSFLTCDRLSLVDRAKQLLKVVFTDFSGWDKKAVLDVVVGSAAFVGTMAVLGILTGGTGFIVVGVALIVSAAVTAFFTGWLASKIDEWQYDNVKKSVKWILDEYASAGPNADPGMMWRTWLHLESAEVEALRSCSDVASKRDLLARYLGQVGDKVDSRFRCDLSRPPEKTRAVIKGVFMDFIEKRDKFIDDRAKEMKEFVDSHQKRVDEASSEFARESGVCPYGFDLRRMAIIFCRDSGNREVDAETVTDYIVAAVRANPELAPGGGADPNASEADINALHAAYLPQVRAILKTPEKQLEQEHWQYVSESLDRSFRARQNFERVRENYEREIKPRISEAIGKLQEVVETERADLASFALDPIQEKNPELVAFLRQRLEMLEASVKAYREMYRVQQEPEPADREDAAWLGESMLDDWLEVRTP